MEQHATKRECDALHESVEGLRAQMGQHATKKECDSLQKSVDRLWEQTVEWQSIFNCWDSSLEQTQQKLADLSTRVDNSYEVLYNLHVYRSTRTSEYFDAGWWRNHA